MELLFCPTSATMNGVQDLPRDNPSSPPQGLPLPGVAVADGRLWPRLYDLGFLAVFFAYAWAGIDPRLLYHWQGQFFYLIPELAGRFLPQPGWSAEYLGRLISQALCSRWLGALALTCEAAVAELRRCAGTQFDPKIVEAFLRVEAEDAALAEG